MEFFDNDLYVLISSINELKADVKIKVCNSLTVVLQALRAHMVRGEQEDLNILIS